jgi:hypothetical protein
MTKLTESQWYRCFRASASRSSALMRINYKCLTGFGALTAGAVKSMELWLSLPPAFLLTLFFHPENECDIFLRNATLSKVHSITSKKIVLFLDVVCEFSGFSLLPNRLSPSTLTGQGSEGVGLEKLNQTWPAPSSGHHSPRIPKTSSTRGRRILEPLNSGNPQDGNAKP